MAITEIRAVVTGERFRKGDFAILRARPAGDSRQQFTREFSILGDFAEGSIEHHLEYRFYGKIEQDSKYGPQLRAQTFVIASPHSRQGVIKYLCRCDGIGPVTAGNLWDKFGSDSVRIMRESPDIAVTACSRLSLTQAESASKFLSEQSVLEDCTIEVMGELDGRHYPKRLVNDVIRRWGNKAAEIIRKNPYRLGVFPRCGFGLCDTHYLDLGLPRDALKRQLLCGWDRISRDREGHTWFPVSAFDSAIKDKVSGNSKKLNPGRALTLGVRHGGLTTCEHDGKTWVSSTVKADAESYIAESIALATQEAPAWPGIDHPAFNRLTDHQRSRVTQAMSGQVGMLLGSPGTGKTFCSAAIIEAIFETHGPASVAVACPSGKAAVRCGEALSEYHINIKASTIHRLLAVQSTGDSGWTFEHGPSNPLPFRFLIIDESSMIGCGLMQSLLAARDRGTGILFVGDINQLPPVEYGAPLRDFRTAGISFGELTEIKRNSGTIVEVCTAIRDENEWSDDKGEFNPDAKPPRNLKLIPATKATAPKTLTGLVKRLRDSSQQTGYDPVWDLQVLIAVNKKSTLSRKSLNTELQNILNPAGLRIKDSPFRVSDKVMQSKNTFLPLDDSDSSTPPSDISVLVTGGKVLVCNGEFGRVIRVQPKRTIVEFRNPYRRVIVPRGIATESDDDSGTGCDMELGYAVTAHKMQGSESPIVIVALDEYPGASGSFGVCDRAWVYTAISRAQDCCFLVGRLSTAKSMCKRQYIYRRKTFLTESIQSELTSLGIDLKTPRREHDGNGIPEAKVSTAALFS